MQWLMPALPVIQRMQSFVLVVTLTLTLTLTPKPRP